MFTKNEKTLLIFIVIVAVLIYFYYYNKKDDVSVQKTVVAKANALDTNIDCNSNFNLSNYLSQKGKWQLSIISDNKYPVRSIIGCVADLLNEDTQTYELKNCQLNCNPNCKQGDSSDQQFLFYVENNKIHSIGIFQNIVHLEFGLVSEPSLTKTAITFKSVEPLPGTQFYVYLTPIDCPIV